MWWIRQGIHAQQFQWEVAKAMKWWEEECQIINTANCKIAFFNLVRTKSKLGGTTLGWHTLSFTKSTLQHKVNVLNMQLPGRPLGHWPLTSASSKQFSLRRQGWLQASAYQLLLRSFSLRLAFPFLSPILEISHSGKQITGITSPSDDCHQLPHMKIHSCLKHKNWRSPHLLILTSFNTFEEQLYPHSSYDYQWRHFLQSHANTIRTGTLP